MIFKVHKATKYPIFKVRDDDLKIPMIVQFYPSFDPNTSIEETKVEQDTKNLIVAKNEKSPSGINASEINLSLGDEDDPNKASLRKTVSDLVLIPRKQTFAEEDQKQNLSLNGPNNGETMKVDIMQTPEKIVALEEKGLKVP